MIIFRDFKLQQGYTSKKAIIISEGQAQLWQTVQEWPPKSILDTNNNTQCSSIQCMFFQMLQE